MSSCACQKTFTIASLPPWTILALGSQGATSETNQDALLDLRTNPSGSIEVFKACYTHPNCPPDGYAGFNMHATRTFGPYLVAKNLIFDVSWTFNLANTPGYMAHTDGFGNCTICDWMGSYPGSASCSLSWTVDLILVDSGGGFVTGNKVSIIPLLAGSVLDVDFDLSGNSSANEQALVCTVAGL